MNSNWIAHGDVETHQGGALQDLLRKADEEEGPAVDEDEILHALPSQGLEPLPELGRPV